MPLKGFTLSWLNISLLSLAKLKELIEEFVSFLAQTQLFFSTVVKMFV